jgi:hypothetical protein
MLHNHPNFAILHISSLEKLLDHEGEVVRRINATPNSGRLLLLDPQRLLRDLRVEITTEALEEWRVAHPEFFARTNREHAYDAVARSQPGDEIRITVKGLFRKGGA